MKTVTAIDFVVMAAYMVLMVGIGLYAARFNRNASDYFRGANRIPWLVAGLSSFMSGFSAWTFTGAAGLAYQKGVVAIFLYLGNALTFLLGYWIFAVRWRRARTSTVMEYLVGRFDERTRQAFSWSTVLFQLFTGASMLYGLGLFVASTCDLPLVWTILGSGLVILAYCVVGGLWAVVITDFLQAVILMPFTLVMLVVSLSRVGGVGGLVRGLPPELTSLHLTSEMGWLYVASWTVMVSFGYNTSAMAQRYFSVDDERSAKKVALLCFVLFVVGAFIWFVPPLTMRVLYPDLRAVWPGLANPHEASYAVASLTLLPNGLVGIMLAAMFSATMSSLSGLFNVHAAVVSKDIYQRLVAPQASERHLLTVGWIATFGVGAAMTALAMGMAAKGQSVFQVMLTFNTIISLAYGPPALLGLVVKRTPAWSGLLSFAVGLALGCYGAFVGHWSLVKNVLVILPTSMLVFLATSLVRDDDPAHRARREALFTRLATPVDVARELQGSVDPTATVFRFLGRATAGVGGLSLLLLPWAQPGERGTVILFAVVTLLLAAGLRRIGRTRAPVLVALVTVALGPAAAQAGIAHVWAVSDGEKVEQDDLASPLRARNGAWDGARTRIFGARNEVLAFQVMVESDAQGIQRLGVALPELRQRGGAARIAYAPPGPDPSQSVGRPIQVFAVHYMNVTETTRADWAWKPGSAAAPRDTLGWKPVQLVPENARADRGGLPVRVAPSRNQALWIEVYTPRDLPAGLYDGVVTVTADGRAHRVPLELQVFGFTLPDANSLDVMVYYEPSQPELYHGRNLDDAYHRFAHRHRVELVHAYDEVAVRAGKRRFDGSDFTKASGYEGPGEALGNRIVPRSFYGPGRGWDDRPTAWRQADAWMSFMERELPGARTFLYMPDEPSPAQYPEIRTLAENVHSNPGAGKRLPVFVTKRWVPELDDSIDFWCSGPQGFDIARAAREKSRGRNYCFYNGGRPDGPSPLIDAPATEARAVAWAAFKHDVDLYFFWHGVHWLHNRQKQGERRQNVWANPITFDNRGQPNKDDHGYLNGDGVLFYPGEEKVHPEEDRGVAGPVATVQLANLRRGLQDHQYLTLARKLGRTAAVDAALSAVVPRVFSDAGDTVGFAETGDAYDAARLELAKAIVIASERGAPGGLGGPYPPRLKSAAEFTSAARTITRPRLLVAERDPFSGLPALKARYAAGARPSDDLPGWALGYLLSGDEALARRAVEYMRANHPPTKGGSSLYLEYLKWSLAFDWLYGWPGFDAALKDRVAGELVAAAERMLALQSLADPAQASYHNHTVRELATAVFPLAAVEGHPSVEARAAPLRARAARALDNILETTDLVNPEGGYHESMDYMRITWAPLALMAELRRTTTGEDPARRHGVFQSMGPTYLYKVLPDGSTARDDDNEFPHLDAVDNVVLGYAVHRFKDPFAAWMLRKREWLPAAWRIPVLEFLWHDDTVAPRDPATTTPAELPRERRFPGIGHVVLRDGWGPDSTWIEFSSGPYFAKHDHLDTNHFAIYRKGHLAVDAGADYTDTESPHYLNHYRRTVAHNTMLVYQPGESFFWGENKWAAANDGGQRMDSSRFWNSVRSLEDWRHTRDLWDRGRIAAFAPVPGRYTYVRGDGTRAYHPSKVEGFVRDLLWLPRARVLFVLDRVRSADASYRKAWLLHGVSEPKVEGNVTPRLVEQGGTAHGEARVVTFEDGEGRLRVHSVLPLARDVIVRGGPGWEFWTPGDESGGPWGSGKNWPLDPPEGGPLPEDPYLEKMWKTFWGDDLERLSPSNRRAVVPGAWRIEVSPKSAARDDVFLNVLEIGDRGAAPLRLETVAQGKGLAGAVLAGEATVLLSTSGGPLVEGEATLPDVPSAVLLLAGLQPGATYDLQLTSGFAPGAPVWRVEAEANDAGVLETPWTGKDGRLRIRRMATSERSAR